MNCRRLSRGSDAKTVKIMADLSCVGRMADETSSGISGSQSYGLKERKKRSKEERERRIHSR